MDTDLYKVDISFEVNPHRKSIPPLTKITLDSELIWNGSLEDVESFEISRYLEKGDHALAIEMYDKPDLDGDQGLEISDLRLGGIYDRSFVWQGVYCPRYPEPWASQQRELGIDLHPELRNTDYLGWNGIWRLAFTAPIFTWIHRIENLGWIYD